MVTQLTIDENSNKKFHVSMNCLDFLSRIFGFGVIHCFLIVVIRLFSDLEQLLHFLF